MKDAMTGKFPLSRYVSRPDGDYSLVYIPGDPHYVEPNFPAMKPLAGQCEQIATPDGKKTWMTWVQLELPSRAGGRDLPRQYLAFQLYDVKVDPQLALTKPWDMFFYCRQIPMNESGSPAQQFFNAVVGVKTDEIKQDQPPESTWNQILSVPKEEVENSQDAGEEA